MNKRWLKFGVNLSFCCNYYVLHCCVCDYVVVLRFLRRCYIVFINEVVFWLILSYYGITVLYYGCYCVVDGGAEGFGAAAF